MYFKPAVLRLVWLQVMSLLCEVKGILNKKPRVISITALWRFLYFQQILLNTKSRPLWLVVAQHAPLFRRDVCSLRFLHTNKTFLTSWTISGSSALRPLRALDSLTFSKVKKQDKGMSYPLTCSIPCLILCFVKMQNNFLILPHICLYFFNI